MLHAHASARAHTENTAAGVHCVLPLDALRQAESPPWFPMLFAGMVEQGTGACLDPSGQFLQQMVS
jgi:hypothetical protein